MVASSSLQRSARNPGNDVTGFASDVTTDSAGRDHDGNIEGREVDRSLAMTNGMIGPARWCRTSLVAGCVALSWPVLDAARSPAAAADQIKIGISRTISDAGYYVADAKGFFREEGIDVSI